MSGEAGEESARSELRLRKDPTDPAEVRMVQVDDHAVFRNGLRELLEERGACSWSLSASNWIASSSSALHESGYPTCGCCAVPSLIAS